MRASMRWLYFLLCGCAIDVSGLAADGGGAGGIDARARGGARADTGERDAGTRDAAPLDAERADTSVTLDSGAIDAGVDAGCALPLELDCNGSDDDCDGETDESSAGCLGGACERRTRDTRSYLFCRGTATAQWLAAVDLCRSMAYDLVKIDDAAENDWVRDTAVSLDGAAQRWWLGASDHGTEGEYVWSVDGSPAAYTNWDVDNPQPNDDIRAQDEDFVFLETNAGGTWFDHFVERARFVCEALL